MGKNVWTEFPAAVGSDFDRQYHHAVGEQTAVTFEAYYPPPLDTWFEVRAYPSAEGLSVFFHDITARVERGRRERFLADLAERARGLTDPDELIADAVRSVGEFLGVSRCLFADIDIEADTCAVPLHYRADDSVASIAGVFPISAFGPFVVAEYKAGRTAVVDDVRADRVKAPPESLAAYEAIGVRAYVAAPVLHSTRLVSALAVHSPVPRHWESGGSGTAPDGGGADVADRRGDAPGACPGTRGRGAEGGGRAHGPPSWRASPTPFLPSTASGTTPTSTARSKRSGAAHGKSCSA